MDLGLAGKVAVVSGASKGIGFETARQLAAEGASVVMAARGEEALLDAVARIEAEGGTARPVVADMTRREDIERAVHAAVLEFGRLDIAVSNVYPTHTPSFEETTDELFIREFDAIVMSVVYLTRAVIPHMKERGGRLVNIGSLRMKGALRGAPVVLSDTTRPAVVGLNKSLSNELGAYAITVNSIAVGSIRTDRQRASYEARTQDVGRSWEAFEADRVAEYGIPLGRLGLPEEVAAVAVFLASEPAGYITGQTISVDGGRMGGLF